MALTYFATQTGSYAADATRRAVFSPYARTSANNPGIIAGGLLSASDLQLSAPASGMSVNISTGEAIVGGSEGGAQGAYHVYNSAQVNLSVPAANPTNPRIDAVVLTMADGQYTQPSDVGGTTNGPVLAEIVGTPTSGATLANLLGAPSIPLSSLLLGYVLVPATATNIVTADISNVAVPAYSQFATVANTGHTNISTSQSTSSTSYTTLATPDQVTGVVLPTNGLIRVWYQATWQESVAGAARASIFLGSSQVVIAPNNPSSSSPAGISAQTGSGSLVNTNLSLGSSATGLSSEGAAGGSNPYAGDATTGQITQPCDIFAAAGTYTVSVRFSASSGSVTVSNRTLRVQAISFA